MASPRISARWARSLAAAFPWLPWAQVLRFMQHFDKAVVGGDKWLMQLGTLSGNPVASVAGLKTMEILRRPGQYETLRQTGRRLQDMQSEKLHKAGIAHQIVGDETLFDVLFTQNRTVQITAAPNMLRLTGLRYITRPCVSTEF